MFWKRKINWEEIKSVFLESFKKAEESDPELFALKTRERRNAYRVQPSEDEPLFFRMDDKIVAIKNISAAGLSFINEDYAIGELFTVRIDLPGARSPFPATFQIIGIDSLNYCHCRFIEINEDASEKIHQYVLHYQKEQVRMMKKISKKDKSTAIPIPPELEREPFISNES